MAADRCTQNAEPNEMLALAIKTKDQELIGNAAEMVGYKSPLVIAMFNPVTDNYIWARTFHQVKWEDGTVPFDPLVKFVPDCSKVLVMYYEVDKSRPTWTFLLSSDGSRLSTLIEMTERPVYSSDSVAMSINGEYIWTVSKRSIPEYITLNTFQFNLYSQ